MENRQSRLETKVQVLDEAAVKRALMRISYEIVEKCADVSNLVLVGIRTRGVPIAEVIAENIQKNSGVAIPVGSLDITFYRDDLTTRSEQPVLNATRIDFDLGGMDVVLVDDVIFTGRTVRAAMEAVFHLGRPRTVQLAVLVDRGLRELPFRPDYVGKNIPTSQKEVICVNIPEYDEKNSVELYEI